MQPENDMFQWQWVIVRQNLIWMHTSELLHIWWHEVTLDFHIILDRNTQWFVELRHCVSTSASQHEAKYKTVIYLNGEFVSNQIECQRAVFHRSCLTPVLHLGEITSHWVDRPYFDHWTSLTSGHLAYHLRATEQWEHLVVVNQDVFTPPFSRGPKHHQVFSNTQLLWNESMSMFYTQSLNTTTYYKYHGAANTNTNFYRQP